MDPTDDRIFDWGANLLLHRALEPATNVFQRGVDRHPRSVKLWIGLAVTFHSAGRSEDAVRALVQATDLDPADPRPYLFLGKLYNIATAEGSLRRERLRRFAELHPDNPQANYYYAMSLWKGSTREHEQEDFGRIESLLKRAAELPPGFPDAHLQLGNLYADQGKTAEAIQEYQRAINRQPDLPDAHYRLAQVLSRTGQKERAQRELAVYEALRKQQAAGTERQNAEIQEFISTIREKSER